jgi:type II secretory pathway component GspD/PulD (secretin)
MAVSREVCATAVVSRGHPEHPMQALVTTVAISLALALAAPAASQQQLPSPNRVVPVANNAGVQQALPAKKAPFVFEAGDADLLELIERCGAYLQFNILVNGSELHSTGGGRNRGRAPAKKVPVVEPRLVVSLQLPVVTDDDGCEELLSSMLWSHGLALVALDRNKSVYEVLSRQGPRMREIIASSARQTPEQVLARPMLRSYVTTVMQTKHINAMLANNALRPFFSAWGQQGNPDSLMIGTVGSKSSVLISGPQFMVASALKLLQEADVPESELTNSIEKRFEEVLVANESLRRRIEQLERRPNPRK